MRQAMPVVTDGEIEEGFQFSYKGHSYVAHDVPDDDGHACGYDENGKDADLWFVWTTLDAWCFVKADLADHEQDELKYDNL
jgi:hypothetical protein